MTDYNPTNEEKPEDKTDNLSFIKEHFGSLIGGLVIIALIIVSALII